MKVLLLSRYGRLGASSRLRSYQYLDFLRSAGLDASVNSLLSDDYVRRLYIGRMPDPWDVGRGYISRVVDLLRAHKYDLIWIEREVFPWFPNIVERVVLPRQVPYVIDFDDAVFHRYDMHPRQMVRTILGGKIDGLMRRARVVIVGNDYLRDRALAAGARRVEVLSTVVDLTRYRLHEAAARSCPIIGWIGTPETQHFLEVISPALAELRRNCSFKVVLVGASPAALPLVDHESVAWSEDTEVESIRNFDIGVMPVPDYPFAKGKCGYKLIQYMACGLPVVASPVGLNSKLIHHGRNGFLAGSREAWVEAIAALLSNHHLRSQMGAEGRHLVEQQYSLKVAGPQLVRILKSACDPRRGMEEIYHEQARERSEERRSLLQSAGSSDVPETVFPGPSGKPSAAYPLVGLSSHEEGEVSTR